MLKQRCAQNGVPTAFATASRLNAMPYGGSPLRASLSGAASSREKPRILPEHGNKIHREMAYHHGVMRWLKIELQFG